MKWIDSLLNSITMYKLVLYELLLLVGVAFVLAFFGFLPYSPFALLFSAFFITTACFIANEISAKIFRAPTNVESVYITALILVLIISPPAGPFDMSYLALASWASILAMASKFIFAIKNKHLFNPAAFAVAVTALAINQSASWWVGTLAMMPLVLVGGLLIARKIRRFDLMLSFFTVSLASIFISGFLKGTNLSSLAMRTAIDTPIFFFAFIMLTEPLTTPPTRTLRLWYGAIVGFLFAPWVHIGSFYTTPELALVAGNIFSYLVSPKQKLLLTLKEQIEIADHTYDFVFTSDRELAYEPGQYMEWTLDHKKPDSRGNRRYFTLASSPTEREIRMGVKFYPFGSSFKHALSNIDNEQVIVASQLSGDFVMPKDTSQKLVFIAGGIGVTPFRSMVKYMVDIKEQRDVTIFYSNKVASDVAYKDVFDEAERELGIKTIYTITDAKSAPQDWYGKIGYVDAKMIAEEVPDYAERMFYISGPHGMVSAFKDTLKKMGVPATHIKTDYFPGFA